MTQRTSSLIDIHTGLEIADQSEAMPDPELPADPSEPEDPLLYGPNPLFRNLTPEVAETRALGRLSFADAMPEMGIRSVFDIIRQPKPAFARQLRTLSNADGELAYDNALCYASQIARSFREEQVSSGRDVAVISERQGVRALVDVGPSYPNLFKENWDQFCKVGAIEAMDGPVAYLGSLRRFAAEKIEGASTSPQRILLAVRRPDLDTLVIDEQSTYKSIPMLDLVNDVLTQGIEKYQREKGDTRPIQQLLAEKKHPFVFPYHFAHQQVSLVLSQDKPKLGELNQRLAMADTGNAPQPIAPGNALALLSELSPPQQRLLLQPRPFAALSRMLGANTWYSPIQSNTSLWARTSTHFEIPPQGTVISVTHESTYTRVELRLNQETQSKTLKVRLQSLLEGIGSEAALNRPRNDGNQGVCLRLDYHPQDNGGAELEGDYHGCLLINVMVSNGDVARAERQLSVDVCTGRLQDPGRALTDDEADFMREHYGIEQASFDRSALGDVKKLCDQAGLDAQQLQELICQKNALPRVSPNCPIVNPTGSNIAVRRMPNAMNYGAVYVNGTGGQDHYKPGANTEQYNNALTLVQVAGSSQIVLGNTSLDRFDRLQRMIRLQRWTGLRFAELDTLIVAAMRAEGEANPALELNQNTLRMLGAYRYFNRQYGIGAEDFAAFVHHLSPFASGEQMPLFDRVFNYPLLFGDPLRLDNTSFSLAQDDAASQQTINQLCAGLGVERGAAGFDLLAAATIAHVGPLARSLPLVSALYRQARVARMFGLSVADCHYLLALLGGDTYLGKLASGVLLPHTEAAAEPDLLDILMQMDQLVRWLKEHKLKVAGLRTLLATDKADAPQNLLERLQQLASDTQANAVTPATIAALKLPNKATGAAIDWYAALRGASLIELEGVVGDVALTLIDNERQLLRAKVTAVAGAMELAPEQVEATVESLTDCLLDHGTRQRRLAEGFVQEHTGLLPEQALMVGRWVGVPAPLLLATVSAAWPEGTAPSPSFIKIAMALIGRFKPCAEAITWANTGARALRAFLVNPGWLSTTELWPQSLRNLQLLKAYQTLFNTLGQPEERLLGYLELANGALSKRPGKRQLAAQAQSCNAALARLLNWNEAEVAVLTAQLPQQTAKTVAHVDWVRRAQALSLETGLSAATLLQACALHANSPDTDWQSVGQAAMAAAG